MTLVYGSGNRENPDRECAPSIFTLPGSNCGNSLTSLGTSPQPPRCFPRPAEYARRGTSLCHP